LNFLISDIIKTLFDKLKIFYTLQHIYVTLCIPCPGGIAQKIKPTNTLDENKKERMIV